MTETNWVLPQRGAGRLYQQHTDLVVNEKFDAADEYVETIANTLRNFLMLETSVRFLLDGPQVNPAMAVISVPFEGDLDRVYTNLADLIFRQMWGYYLSGDPKSTHYGVTNLVLEGHETSLIRRETEKFLDFCASRNELAARVMRNFTLAADLPPFKRDVFFRGTAQRSLDIELGVRLFTFGEGVNRKTAFLPIAGGDAAKDRLYYNIESIVHQNLVSYDELNDRYLPVSEELVLREIEGVLDRARRKENTRKKLLNGLTMHTVLLEDPSQIRHLSLADLYYDKVNRIDLLEEASQRSRDMFSSNLIRNAEIVGDTGMNLESLQMEERVYIEQPDTQQAEAVPAYAGGEQQQEEEKAAPAPATDGLTEL